MTNTEMIAKLKRNYKEEAKSAVEYLNMKDDNLSTERIRERFYEHIGARNAYGNILAMLGVQIQELQEILDEVNK